MGADRYWDTKNGSPITFEAHFIPTEPEDYISEDSSINHPKHYNAGKYECIDVIEDWKLGFCLGNAVKYICRAGHKGSKKEDLKKAIWYLQRELNNEE